MTERLRGKNTLRGAVVGVVMLAAAFAPQGAALAHDAPSGSNTIAYINAHDCGTQQSTMNHGSGFSAGYAWSAWCGALRTYGPGGIMVAGIFWINGDGRGGGRQCFNTGWHANNTTTYGVAVGYDMGVVAYYCGLGRITVDTWTVQHRAAGWVGGFQPAAAVHQY